MEKWKIVTAKIILAALVSVLMPMNAFAKNYIASVFVLFTDGINPMTTTQNIRLSLWSDGRIESGDISSGSINTGAPNYAGFQSVLTMTPDSQGRVSIAFGSVPNFPQITHENQFLMIERKETGDPDTSYVIYKDIYINSSQLDRFPLIENGPDIFEGIYTNDATSADVFTVDRNDDAATNVGIQFGETLAKTILYDVTNTRFTISDDVRIEGNIGVLGQAFIADDHAVTDSPGILNLGRKNGVWQSLKWDEVNSHFDLSNDLHMNSGQILEVRVENVSALPGGAVGLGPAGIGRVVQLTATDSIAPGCTTILLPCVAGTYTWNGTEWRVLDGTAGGGGGHTQNTDIGTTANTFTLDLDDSGGDITLQLGQSLGEKLRWDISEGSFTVSDDWIPDTDLAYNLGSPALRWNTIYVDNIETGDKELSLGTGGLSFEFVNAQSTLEGGRTFTIEAGDVVKLDPTGNEEVKLTTNQNDHPIGVAANDTNEGDTVNVIILGKADVHCTGIVTPGQTIQSSNTIGYVKQGPNSNKVVGTAITGCIGGVLNAVIHLE